MKLAAGSLIAVFAMLLAPQGAVAKPNPKPSPVATQSPVLTCPAAVARIFLVDASKETGWTYAIQFENFSDTPGRLSGTVSLFAGNLRYDVPFSDAVAVPSVAKAVPDAVPIVVKFPADAGIEAAYLSAIAGPNGGDCTFGDIALMHLNPGGDPSGGDVKGRVMRVDAATVDRARKIAPITAPPAVLDPVPTCDTPDSVAKVTYAEKASYPEISGIRGDQGEVIVAIQLTADGDRTAAWIWKTSGNRLLDEAGYTSAIHSYFQGGTFRCRPVFDVFLFSAFFQH